MGEAGTSPNIVLNKGMEVPISIEGGGAVSAMSIPP